MTELVFQHFLKDYIYLLLQSGFTVKPEILDATIEDYETILKHKIALETINNG